MKFLLKKLLGIKSETRYLVYAYTVEDIPSAESVKIKLLNGEISVVIPPGVSVTTVY